MLKAFRLSKANRRAQCLNRGICIIIRKIYFYETLNWNWLIVNSRRGSTLSTTTLIK